MIVGDFLFIPKNLPKGSETEMFATETVLVSEIPSVIKDLPVAFGLHSDTAVSGEVQLNWEIYGDAKRLGDFGGPLRLDVAPNEVCKVAFPLPPFEVPAEGQYTFVLFVDGDRCMDTQVEIRLPRDDQ